MVVGVSDEAQDTLDAYIEKKGVEFAVIRSPDAGRLFGVRGFPTFYQVDPFGKIIAQSYPSEAQIKKGLRHVTLTPPMPEDSRFEKLRRTWDDTHYSKVAQELDLLAKQEWSQQMESVIKGLRKRFDQMLSNAQEQVAKLASGPDYLAATEQLKQIEKEFSGLAPGKAAKAQLEIFRKDKNVAAEIRGFKELKSLKKRYDPRYRSQLRNLQEALEKLISKRKGTRAAAEAQSYLRRISKGAR